MNLSSHISVSHDRGFIGVFFLATAFLFGLYCGSEVAVQFLHSSFLLMSPGVLERTSIVGPLTVAFLPFILTVISVYCLPRYALVLIAFIRAFIFSYSIRLLCGIFGEGGWAVALFSMFSSFCLLPLDCWIWVRRLLRQRQKAALDFLVYSIFGICMIAMDYYYISVFTDKISMF